MGNCCSSEGLALSASADVDAPIEVCWETRQDVPHEPSFISQVDQIDLLQKKGGQLKPLPESQFEYKEGALWRTSGLFGETNYECIDSVTSLTIVRDTDNDNELIKVTVRVNSQFTHNKEHKESTHTATYIITRIDANRCQIQSTMAFLPVSCLGIFNLNRLGKQARDFAQCAFQQLTNEIAREAERRHQNNIKKKNSN